MGRIDVSELMQDPEFVESIDLITRFPRVDGQGQNQMREVKEETFGSVQPASGKTIFRLPEEFRVANVREFYLKGKIIATAPGKYSSILVFRGERFQVQTVQDWSNWGAGWTEGTCVAEVPA